LQQPECHASIEDNTSRGGIRMPEITIPESAYPAIQSLAHLSEEDFRAFLSALERAKPAATPNLFSKHVAEHAPQINSSTIKMIVNELFSMNYAFGDVDISTAEIAQSVAEAAFSEQSEEFPIDETDRDILKDRLEKLFALKASLGLTSKAVGLLTDAEHLFFTAKILTDVRPIFNEEGDVVEATVILHNLVLHYGESGDHRDFVVTLDTNDIKALREVLDRADNKAKALKSLLKRSDISYLDLEE
jgi:uncharacterized protein (DUF1778 family)